MSWVPLQASRVIVLVGWVTGEVLQGFAGLSIIWLDFSLEFGGREGVA